MGPAPGISAQRHTTNPARAAAPSRIYQTLTKTGPARPAVEAGGHITPWHRDKDAPEVPDEHAAPAEHQQPPVRQDHSVLMCHNPAQRHQDHSQGTGGDECAGNKARLPDAVTNDLQHGDGQGEDAQPRQQGGAATRVPIATGLTSVSPSSR
jgi:hypothetical protein